MHERLKKVSVIIPVYNVEKYLAACLDSVLGQSLQELECICIDDASPDRCGEILDAYAEKDERVRVLHLSENHMQGYGRNRGLEMAQGEYVYFLDSDDMITSNALEELYMLAKQDDLGGIFFDSQVLVDSEQVEHFADSYICMRKGVYPAAVTSGAELLDLFVKNNEWMVYVQRQFWRREYLLNNSIFFPEKTEHEDELFSFKAIILADRVRYLRKDYFIRRYRDSSVMTRAPHPKDFVGYFRTFIQMIEFTSARQLSGVGVDYSINLMYSNALRFIDDFKNREDPAVWFLPEEQREYHVILAILKCQEIMRLSEDKFWARLATYDAIWLYGAGRVARSVFMRLRKCGIRVSGFMVTSTNGNPEELFELPVYPVETITSLPNNNAVVIAMASSMQSGPATLLKQKGFPFFLYSNNVLQGVF